MKPTRHVTAMVILTAFAAAGCSKHDTAVQAKATPADAAAAKPVTTTGESPAVNAVDEEGLELEPSSAVVGPVSFGDGETAYHAGKYTDATAIFDRYTGQRPANAWGHYMLGLSAWKSGDLAKSEQAFEKALRIDANHVKSLVNLSRVFIEQKRYDDAIVRLTRAAEIEPESPQVHRLLGRTYHDQGKTDEAVAAYRRAIEVNELDAWSMNNLGLLFLETARAEDALPLLVKAAELKPDVPVFHNNLGMALEHTGRFRAAATAYKDALEADPSYTKAKRNLARVEAVDSDN